MANPDKACKAERAYATAPRRTFWVGVACALVGAGLWGVSGACAQYLFSHYGITPMFATAVRSLVASLIFFGVLFFRRRYLLQLMWGSEARTKLAFLAFGVALFVDQFAYSMTIAHTNAGTATVLQMLGTVFVMLFTCVLGRHLPKASEFAGLVCAFVATVLIATQGDLGTLVLPAAGLFWGLLNALSVALYVMVPRNCGLFDRFGSFAATGVGMLVTCACAGVAYAVQLAGGAGAPESVAGMDAFGWLVLLGGLTVLGTFVSFGLYLRGVAAVGSVTGSLLGAIEPVSASVCAWVFLGTAFSGFDWAGLVLMLGMLALVTLGGKPKPLIPRPRQ
ncbi:DMT family transporter [Senegalimassilia faecalis]|uniref:DMT family transporter n=1 Tax=Senegalimassilia faecalis TaxID=2509433 RepID=A0A4Q2JZQ4_9ACTN|nr:DMT family transporter [Senegalimassilia faecalis]RXZ54456.1 DMT family transporter [Senegalimassilia faecalis]